MADGDINAGGAVVSINLRNNAKNGQQVAAVRNDLRMVQNITKNYSSITSTELKKVSQVWNRTTNIINTAARSAIERIQHIASSTTMFGANLTQIGSTVKRAGDFISGHLVNALNEFKDRGDVFSKLADKTGASAEALSAIGYAAEQSGSNVDELGKALNKMQDNIANATKGQHKDFNLGNLNFSADVAGLDATAQFKAIAETISRIENPTQRAQAAIDAFPILSARWEHSPKSLLRGLHVC